MTLFTWDSARPTGHLGEVQHNLRYMWGFFSSLILQAAELVRFPLIFLQDCSCVGDGAVKWSCSWALGCYRTPCAENSSDPWILNVNVLLFPVTFTGALGFWFPSVYSNLLSLSHLLLLSLHDQDFAHYFQCVFQPFLRAALCTLKKVSLSVSCLIPTFTSPPLYTQLIGESRTENSWCPNIAGIQQAQEKHLTRLSPLSMIKMAGPLTKTL